MTKIQGEPKDSMKGEIKNIIFGNARKGAVCDDIEDGQILGLRTGEGLEFDNLALGLTEYVKNYAEGRVREERERTSSLIKEKTDEKD